MLREFKNVRQERVERGTRSALPKEGRRRWFESDELELVIWFGQGPAVRGFQLLYDAGTGEHALTWREGAGFDHARVDPGDDPIPYKRTPVLEPDGAAPWEEIIRRFDTHSETLEPELRAFVGGRLATRGHSTPGKAP